MPRRALHHRKSSGVAWGLWSMNLRQHWPGRSANHLRWSSAALCSSELPVWSRFRTISQTVVRPPWSGNFQMVRKRDQKGPSHGQRPTKGGGRSSQALLVPSSGPILAEIYQPKPHTTPELPQWCSARRGNSNKYQQKVGTRLCVSNSVFLSCSDRFRSM